MSSDAHHQRFVRSAARRVVIAAGVCALLLLTLGVWSFAVTAWKHARNPVPGEFYLVDGSRMHLYCSGARSPTIVLEAGLGNDWLDWQTVQPGLSRLTRVCSYDRAGLGWSEPRSGLRDAETIARQLHTLLGEAGVRSPLILAGHSGGGIYIREFAREFPREVAGVVLVDAASPQQFDELPGFRASFEEYLRESPRHTRWQKLRVLTGVQRLVGRCRGKVLVGMEGMAGQIDAEKCRLKYEGGDAGEYTDFEAAARQAARLNSFGSVPLLILSKDPNRRTEKATGEDVQVAAAWDREQEELKSLSAISWRVVARGSPHEIYYARPELVIGEVSRLLVFLRGGQQPQFGSTKME
jgi:pimeloyl-ACP methyl ester carboxylesterase